MKLPSVFVILGLALLLAGCAGNPYNQFYQPAPGLQDLAQRRTAPAPELPELYRGNDPNSDISAAAADGYIVIGSSNYNGPNASDSKALEQGKRVGADRILVYGKYAGTVQTAVPLTIPTTQTSTSNGNATVFGNGGMATINGSSVTTTYGSQTTFVPMSVNRYDFLAIYFVRVKHAFGAQTRNLNAQESQQVGTVNGAVLTAIVRASPAAASGFLPGDIIMKVDGQPVIDWTQFSSRVKQLQGRRVTISIIRGGKKIELPVTLANIDA